MNASSFVGWLLIMTAVLVGVFLADALTRAIV